MLVFGVRRRISRRTGTVSTVPCTVDCALCFMLLDDKGTQDLLYLFIMTMFCRRCQQTKPLEPNHHSKYI